MSADNYYVIRKDRQGYFVPIMGFASSNGAPLVRATDPRFKEFHAAIEYAALEYTEYGINVDDECYSDATPVHFRRLTTGHYATCPAQDNYPGEKSDCICEAFESEWEKDYSLYAK
jgi:hypothetical protein